MSTRPPVGTSETVPVRPEHDVPVLLFTGPVGVGKTTVAGEASRLLAENGIKNAAIDLALIACCYPAPAGDPWNERLLHANLACMWENCARAGAGRLIVSRVLEARSLLGRIQAAVPGAVVTVVRLRAPVDVLHRRIAVRESGRDAQWFLDAATALASTMEQDALEDHVVDNLNRTAAETAREALLLAGWLS